MPTSIPAVKAFYEYHQCVLEPWDGPAALAFTDGVLCGAAVDRNGLRPCRYKVRRDGLVVAGSEVGLVDLDPREVVECGKVGPGEVLVVDTRRGEVIRNLDAKREVAGRRPYARWVARYMATLAPDPARVPPVAHRRGARPRAARFGYGFEDLRLVLEPMGSTGADPVWSMGDDTPIPPLSAVPQSLYAYFRQRFAQVTNPPIDSLRESMVMSLRMHLGRRGSPLLERPCYARMLRLEHPVLLAEEMAALRNVAGFSTVTLDAVWDPTRGPDGLRPALTALRRAAERAARRGAHILIISDRAADATPRADPDAARVGAVRQHLVHTGLRARVGLVAEAGDAFDIHHFATLIGYGAEAVHPWLALESLEGVFGEAGEPSRREREADADAAPVARGGPRCSIAPRPRRACSRSCRRWGSRRCRSYCGAQIFEVLGLGHEVIGSCFAGTASPIGGIGFEEIAEDVLARHRAAYPRPGRAGVAARPRPGALPQGGRGPRLGAADRGGAAAGGEGGSGPEAYARIPREERAPPAGRPARSAGVRAGTPVPLEEVEPAEAIRRRFVSSAMSLGALSPEAHATLSIAMNRMGARSNSGEGGEDPHNYHGFGNGDRADNRIKQVASARFGVTTEYLARAEELEIKIVQGAKPGEGGQLPAHKVTELIARLRHCGARHLSSSRRRRTTTSTRSRTWRSSSTISRPSTRGPGSGVKLVSRDRRGHRGGRRGQGLRRLRADRGAQRRHRRVAALIDQACGLALGAGPGRGAGHPGAERAAPPDRGPHRRRPQDRTRRGHRRAARRRELRFRHRAAGGDGMRHGPAVPPQHLPHRHRHPAGGPARQVQGHAGAGHRLLHPAGGGGAQDSGGDGRPHARRDHRPERSAGAGGAPRGAAGADARSVAAAGGARGRGRRGPARCRRGGGRWSGTIAPGSSRSTTRSWASSSRISTAACPSRATTRSATTT